MAIKQKQIDYADSVDNIALLVVKLIEDIKAKKSIGAILTDCIEPMMAAVQSGGDLSADLAANKKVVEETIGYRLGDITAAILG